LSTKKRATSHLDVQENISSNNDQTVNKKRKIDQIETSNFECPEFDVLPSPISTTPNSVLFTSGCQWSSLNYSCAYDSVFMCLFSIYLHFNTIQKANMRTTVNTFNQLGDSFHILSQAPMPSTNDFNTFRDLFRDYLSAYDPEEFQRYGPHGASVDLILEHLFPRKDRLLGIYRKCTNCGTTYLGYDEIFVQILSEFDNHMYNTCNDIRGQDSMTLGSSLTCNLDFHLKLWYNNLITPYEHANPCCSSTNPISTIVPLLKIPPPIIFFEISPNNRRSISPQYILNIPSTIGTKKYILSSIIYLGSFHFSCRMFTNDGSVWTHDGRVNSGLPILESQILPDPNSLLVFQGKKAQTYIYTLRDDE